MNSVPPLRVGIVGCGNVSANNHAPALRRLAAVTPVGVADPVPARRHAVLQRLHLPPEAGFESHLALLADRSPDYVIVAVPPSIRRQIVSDCAQRAVHVLSEKPIATRPAEAHALQNLMEAAGLKFGLVHNYLYHREYRLVRQLIADGAVGEIRHVTLNFLGVPDKPGAREYRPTWRHDPVEAGGGVLLDMIHAFYLAEYLVGAPIEAVDAIVDRLDPQAGIVEDFALVHLYFRHGYATINMGWGNGPGGLEVAGSAGRILVFYQDYSTGPFAPLESITLVNQAGRQEVSLPQVDQAGDTFLAIHQDFVSAIQEDRAPVAPVETGRRNLEAALAAYTAAVQGCVTALPLAPDHPVYLHGVAGLRELPQWAESRPVWRGLFGLGT